MADARGGYRQPSNPAPVSGPGALSRRTDGGPMDGMTPPAPTQGAKYMPGMGYGQGGNMQQQQGAPLAGAPTPPVPPAVPLAAPTMRPNEPVTTGINSGPGAGSEVLQTPSGAQSPSMTIKRLAQTDPTGDSELIYRALVDRGL